jgi:hypothetical protein
MEAVRGVVRLKQAKLRHQADYQLRLLGRGKAESIWLSSLD